jgi:uncharacterized protein with HEPN domain
MPSKDPRQRLQDIIENCELAKIFAAEMSLPAFASDAKVRYAVERAIMIVSEAVRRLPDDIKHRHPHIDWAAAAGIGNKLRHDYDAIDAAILWNTVTKSLPLLRRAAEDEMRRLAAASGE